MDEHKRDHCNCCLDDKCYNISCNGINQTATDKLCTLTDRLCDILSTNTDIGEFFDGIKGINSTNGK
jgi:hypothetical protein